MKVLMYGVSPDEQVYVDQWEKSHPDDQIKTTSEILNSKSIDQAKGFDAIAVKQLVGIDDEAIYQKLAQFGIKHLALRIVGFNIVNFDLVHKYHLVVTHVPAYSPRAIAENGLTAAMFLLRHWGKIQAQERNLNFTLPRDVISQEIYTKTVGIIGLGRIGGATAEIYHALGAHVIGYDPVPNAALEAFVDYTDFDTVIKNADIISLHTPLDETTNGMIGAKQFKEMKKDAILINQARGHLVYTAALIDALKNHEIAAAGLDTLADETKFFGHKFDSPDQLPEDYRELAKMDNVVISPHSAFYTRTAVKNMVNHSMNDIKRVAAGKKPVYPVDL